jgi:hypothetical protein
MNTQNTQTARLLYQNALALVINSKLDPAVVKLTQSDLVLEQQLLTTMSQYTFPVLNNVTSPSGSLFNTEIRLTQQDSLICGAWGFFLLEPTSGTDATAIAHTYPNAATFVGGGEAAALETLYNSYSQVKVNNDVVFPVWHLSRNRVVPQSQKVAAAANQNGIGQDQIDLSSDGFFPLEPNLVIVGSKGYVITVNLPAALAAVGAFTRARIHYRGLLAQNSTIIT